MGADLSRVRFDALRDHAGVVLQQGRLLLDADWNELVAIVERRIRAGVADLDSDGPAPGIAGVAVVPRTTPHGFEITPDGRGAQHRSAAGCTSTACSPRTTAPAGRSSTRSWPDVTGSADTPYELPAVLADARPRCRPRAPTWPTSTCGSAR